MKGFSSSMPAQVLSTYMYIRTYVCMYIGSGYRDSTYVTRFAKTVPNGTFTKLYFIVLLLCTYFEEIVVQILASYE